MGRNSDNKKYVLDVHGLTIREVDALLNKLIWRLDTINKEVEVIHGFNYGTTLREHLRNDYFNSRVDEFYILRILEEQVYSLEHPQINSIGHD